MHSYVFVVGIVVGSPHPQEQSQHRPATAPPVSPRAVTESLNQMNSKYTEYAREITKLRGQFDRAAKPSLLLTITCIQKPSRIRKPAMLKHFEDFALHAARAFNLKTKVYRQLPTIRDKVSVLKSSFVHSKHWSHFERRAYRLMIRIDGAAEETMLKFMWYVKTYRSAYGGGEGLLGVTVNRYEYEPIPKLRLAQPDERTQACSKAANEKPPNHKKQKRRPERQTVKNK